MVMGGFFFLSILFYRRLYLNLRLYDFWEHIRRIKNILSGRWTSRLSHIAM